MVFCCNSGDEERELQKDSKPVAVEHSRSTSMAVPGRVAWGELGREIELALLSPVDLEPRMKM